MNKQEMFEKIHDHFGKCNCGDDFYMALEMGNFDDLLEELYQCGYDKGYSNGYDIGVIDERANDQSRG